MEPARCADYLANRGVVEWGAIFKADVDAKGTGKLTLNKGERDTMPGDVEGWIGRHGCEEMIGRCTMSVKPTYLSWYDGCGTLCEVEVGKRGNVTR